MRNIIQNRFLHKRVDASTFLAVFVSVMRVIVAAFVAPVLLLYTPSALATSDILVKADDTPAKLPIASKPKVTKAAARATKKEAFTPDAPAKQIGVGTQQFSSLPERFVWNKAPIPVTLGVGPEWERRVSFPAQMFIAIPSELDQFMRVQTVDNTSYFTALAPFSSTRIIAEDRINGTVILLDMRAMSTAVSTAPVEIYLPQTISVAGVRGAAGEETEPMLDEVALARYASKQLYAPRRLTTSIPGVRRVYLDNAPIPGLYRGELVKATPIASWRGADRWVTAVMLKNESSRSVELNPTALRGDWRAAVFQHGRLLAKGSDADTTAVYLISDHAFDESR